MRTFSISPDSHLIGGGGLKPYNWFLDEVDYNFFLIRRKKNAPLTISCGQCLNMRSEAAMTSKQCRDVAYGDCYLQLGCRIVLIPVSTHI